MLIALYFLAVIYYGGMAIICIAGSWAIVAGLITRRRRLAVCALVASFVCTAIWIGLYLPFDRSIALEDDTFGYVFRLLGYLTLAALFVSATRVFAPGMEGIAIASRQGLGSIIEKS